MKIKHIATAAVVLGALALLAGCSSSSSSSSKVDKIKSAKVLKVALSADYPPFEFQTLQNGKNTIVGSDVDLANAIGKKLGVKVDIENMDFNNVLATVQNGKADIAISGISEKPDRMAAFDFSTPYYQATNLLVVKKSSADKYKSISDLAGKPVSAQKGSVQEDAVKNQMSKSNLVSLPAVNDEINELKAGQVQGAVIENLIAKSYVAQNPDLEIVNSVTLKSPDSNYAVAMPKNSGDLKKTVDSVVKELKDNGQLDKSIQTNYSLSQQSAK